VSAKQRRSYKPIEWTPPAGTPPRGWTSTPSTTGGTITAPYWVKLERRGNVITAYQSPDGTTWSRVASDTFGMPADVLVGLAVSSHDPARLPTAVFDSVAIR